MIYLKIKEWVNYMDNYLKILENSRDKIKELEAELKIVNGKINKLDKKNKAIHQAYAELVKKIESLSENMIESDELLNNAAIFGVLVILTLIISFFLFRVFALPVLIPSLGVIGSLGITYILREKHIKRKYHRMRSKNNLEIIEEKDNFVALDKEHKEVNEQLSTCYKEKYSIESSITEEEQIVSEIIGYFAPILDDLIEQDLSSSEYLTEVISRISPNK